MMHAIIEALVPDWRSESPHRQAKLDDASTTEKPYTSGCRGTDITRDWSSTSATLGRLAAPGARYSKEQSRR